MERFWRNSWCGMLAVLVVGAAFLLQPGTAEAGISTLHPGAGNRPPKTPEWNVEQSRDSGNAGVNAEKSGTKGVQEKCSCYHAERDAGRGAVFSLRIRRR